MCHDIHDSVQRVFVLLWVKDGGVMVGKCSGEFLKFWYGHLTLDEGTGLFEGGGKKHGDGGVE